MAITPLDIRKMEFPPKLRGLDPQGVREFLELVAEELAVRLSDVARLEQENHELRRRLGGAEQRQQELQVTMLHAQKLAQEITENAKREATVLLKEAEVTADAMVSQAIEQAQRVESKIRDLRTQRREMQLRLRHALEHYRQLLEDDVEDERTTAIVHTMPRPRPAAV